MHTRKWGGQTHTDALRHIYARARLSAPGIHVGQRDQLETTATSAVNAKFNRDTSAEISSVGNADMHARGLRHSQTGIKIQARPAWIYQLSKEKFE